MFLTFSVFILFTYFPQISLICLNKVKCNYIMFLVEDATCTHVSPTFCCQFPLFIKIRLINNNNNTTTNIIMVFVYTYIETIL